MEPKLMLLHKQI